MTSLWFIQSGRGAWGPFAVEQLQAMAAAGQLQPGMLASRDQVGWITAAQIPGLVFTPPGFAPVTAVSMNLAPVSIVPVSTVGVSVVPVGVAPVSVVAVNVVPVNVVTGVAASPAADVATVDSPAINSSTMVHESSASEIAAAAELAEPRLSRAVRRQNAKQSDWLLPAAAIGGGLAVLLILIVYFSSGAGPRETAVKPKPPKAAGRSTVTAEKATTTDSRTALVHRSSVSEGSARPDERLAAPRIAIDEMEDRAEGDSAPASEVADAVSPASAPSVVAATTVAPHEQPMPAEEPAAATESNADEKAGATSAGKQLLAAFRRTKSPAQRDEIVDQVLQLGSPAVEQLLAAINQEIRGQLRAYNKRVAAVTRSKVGAQIGAEVEQLRAQIIAVRDREDLTKDMIVKEVDPALAKLNNFLLNGSMLIDRSPNLQKQREGLLTLGKYWERCVDHLAEARLAEGVPEESKAAREPANFESYLQSEENMILEPAVLPPQTRAILATNAVLAERLDPEEARGVLACNMTRCLVGLAPLSIDPRLCAAARDHSHDMETLGFFSHQSSVPGKEDPWARAKNFETTASGENIFMGIADGSVAHQGWMHSPGHFKNLLGDHTRIGLGRSGVYFTQMFGR